MRCLGTLIRMRELGHTITLVCITSGDKGLAFDDEPDQARAAAVRAAEMAHVCAELGAEYHCLDREDGFTEYDPQLRRELIELLRGARADLVFTHWVEDYNPDHVVTARAVVDAALFTNLPSFVPGTPVLPRPPGIFHCDPGDGYGFESTHFVELDAETLAEKARLIRLHTSQMDVLRQLRGRDYADDMVDDARRQGARMLVEAAEAFRPSLAERRIPWPTALPGSRREQ